MKPASSLSRLCVLLLCGIVIAQAQTFVTYDRFEGDDIDPSKWEADPVCGNPGTIDCAREVRSNKLHLLTRTYGNQGSDEGSGFDTSSLNFENPAAISAISARVIVQRAETTACGTNAQASTTHAIITGKFFNSGSGNPEDDVEALLILDRRSDSEDPPNVLTVVGFLGTAGGFFGFARLGGVSLGEAAVISVQWERPHQQFVFTLAKPGSPTSSVFVSYPQNDTTPPAAPFKSLGVRTFPANCTTSSTLAAMKATFDNVRVKMIP